MDWSAVAATIATLPRTFRRDGPNYVQFEASLVAALSEFTTGVDSLVAQIPLIDNASGKWLDVWGQCLGVPRASSESRVTYLSRIKATVPAWRSTVPALIAYMDLAANTIVSISESNTGAGWTMTLPTPTALTNAVPLETNLAAIRPAGVPYIFSVQGGGSFVSTSNFFSRSRARGSFLTASIATAGPTVAPNTNNTAVSLPLTLMTDPTLNPTS